MDYTWPNEYNESQSTPQHRRRQPPSHINVSNPERVVSGALGGALAAYGIKQRTPGGIALAALGGALIYRAASGHCHLYGALGIDTARTGNDATRHALHEGEHLERTITIDRPVDEVYTVWRNLENLPRFMENLRDVHQIDEKHSHWVATAPAGRKVEWNAEIINETPNEIIAWRSLPGSDIDCAGIVRFEPIEESGTLLHVKLRYRPPAGKLGITAAKVAGQNPARQLTDDLRRFKQMMEFNEFTNRTQPPLSHHYATDGGV